MPKAKRTKGSKPIKPTNKVSSGKWIQSAVHPSRRGAFTRYCGGKVTAACIDKGLHSPSQKIQAQAKFAKAVRKF